MIVALTYLVVLGLAAGVKGYGNGAAPTACVPMKVAHGVPQAGPSPYYISLPNGQTTYSVGHQVKLCIRASEVWRGTLVQARPVDDVIPVGTWSSELPRSTRLMTCSNADDSVTHANGGRKYDNSCFLWNPPTEPAGEIFFIATVATTKDIWWMNLTTSALTPESEYGSAPAVSDNDTEPETPVAVAPNTGRGGQNQNGGRNGQSSDRSGQSSGSRRQSSGRGSQGRGRGGRGRGGRGRRN
ncbi:hypothetical protein NP493_634g00034 [Ridgeia piscesae]|uniref:Reelin domain-containing protein n=1 Tax=Ridgeia piscesae TaxID=27915 RepID=A0AAD9KSV0_RIDPI|nr:hypothetical protein NP493_634g00034 [Ridgeia piscesae]